MNALQNFYWTLAFWTLYTPLSYIIDWYFGIETNIPALVIIGLFFSLVLIVFLIFGIPEKTAELFEKKEETDNIQEELDNVFERSQDEGGEKIENQNKSNDEFVT